jgi:hypothetical protein
MSWVWALEAGIKKGAQAEHHADYNLAPRNQQPHGFGIVKNEHAHRLADTILCMRARPIHASLLRIIFGYLPNNFKKKP